MDQAHPPVAKSITDDRSDVGAGASDTMRIVLVLATIVILVMRLAFAMGRQLIPDEAYYWVWSRHLAAGYLDHPPMVALLIRLGTACLGTSELGIRWMAIVLAGGTVLIAMWMAARLGMDRRAVAWVGLILITSPLINFLGGVMTPDTPFMFFATAAVSCAVAAVPPTGASRPRWWIGVGIMGGAALVSKYMAVLPATAIGLAMISSRRGRTELRRPWPWLGVLIALAIFSPVVVWNATHDWRSFRFQLEHGLGDGQTSAALNELQYIASQFVVLMPILFCIGLLAVAYDLRRWKSQSLPWRMILISAILPLAFFAISARRHRAELNWPICAQLPLVPLLVRYAGQDWAGRRGQWLRVGGIVAACGTVVCHLPEMVWKLMPSELHVVQKWDELFGWHEMAEQVDRLSDGAACFAETYETAAELAFYLPGRPQVWMMGQAYPTALDDFTGRPDVRRLDRVVLVRRPRNNDKPDPPPELYHNGFDRFRVVDLEERYLGHELRRRQVLIAWRSVLPGATETGSSTQP